MMRKIVAALFMSLDGVVEANDEWQFPYFNDEMMERIEAGIAQADTVLLGRRTYLGFAELWSKQPGDSPMAVFMNNAPKYVVSATLDTLDWHNSILVTGDLAAELTKLKEQAGKDILIPGSPTLVRSLLGNRLIDELSLDILPIVVGSGVRLFEGMPDRVGLELVASTTCSNGVVELRYEPADV